MKHTLTLLTALLLAPLAALHAATPDLSKITSRAGLDAVTIRDTIPASLADPGRFIRLEVTMR